MAEQLDLTTPETFPTPSAINSWRIVGLQWIKTPATVIVVLQGSNGETRTYTITNSDAATYIVALNKRNATTKSNEKWTLEQLVAKGYLAGTISGTPD
jgi:hypothetical protein